MSDEWLGHGFGGDCLKRDCSYELREAIRDKQQISDFAWGRDKLAKNGDGYKLQGSKYKENYLWFVVSA